MCKLIPRMLVEFGGSPTHFVRPPWTAEVQKLQELISAKHGSPSSKLNLRFSGDEGAF